MREGKSAVAAGNFQGAVVLFRAALEKDPNDFQVRTELADAYMQLGRYAQAEQELQKVKMQAPSYAELPLKMGELHVRMRQYAKAAKAMGPYLKAHPQSSRGYEILGQAEIGEADLQHGEDDLRTALKLDEKNRSARLVLAQLLINNGQREEGRQLLLEATAIAPHWKEPYSLLGRLALIQDKPDEALGFYQKVLADDPSDLNALYHEGVAYLAKGDSAQALALADKIVKKNPQSSKGWQLRGLAHYRQKQGAQAIVDFQEALKHQDDLASYYFLGLAYSSTSQYELALNQFQKVLDYRPKSLLPRIMVATTLLRQQRYSDAVQQALIAIQNDPKSALAHNILGSAYMAQGHYEDAMKEFDLAIDLDPKLVDAHLKKGLYRMSQGKFDKAEEEIGQAVAIAPELLDTRLILANYYMRQKNYQAAAAALQEGLRGKPSDAILYDSLARIAFARNESGDGVSYLRKAQKANPAYFSPYFHLASYFLTQNAPERALEEYQGVLNHDPKNVKALLSRGLVFELTGQETKAVDCYQQAWATGKIPGILGLLDYYYRKGNEQKILALLDEALRTHQDNIELLGLKGRALVAAKRYDEAIPVFKHLEELAPGGGYPGLIDVYLRQGDVAGAFSVAQRVIRKDPSSAYGYQLLGALYRGEGKPDQAFKAYEQGLAIRPGNRDLLMGMARLNEQQDQQDKALQLYLEVEKQSPDYYPAIFAAGSIYDRLGDKQKALKKYQRALALANNYVPALNNLAYLYAEHFKNKEEALNLAMMAYRSDPSNLAVLDTLGYVLLKNGRIEPATKILGKVAELLPGNPSVLFHLALAYQAGGKTQNAIVMLKKALALGTFPEAEQATRLLAKLGN